MSGRTVPGAGQTDGAGDYEPTRRQVDIGDNTETWLAEAECLGCFRHEHTEEAAVLDAAMVAANMADIAGIAGASSVHTGKKLLTKACETLRAYRAAFGMQILPTRAA
jgi:hypothetical protein